MRKISVVPHPEVLFPRAKHFQSLSCLFPAFTFIFPHIHIFIPWLIVSKDYLLISSYRKKVLALFILCLHHPHTHFTSTFLIIQLYQDVRCINRTRCYCLNYCYATIIHKWNQYNCTSFLMQNFVFLEVSDCLYFSPTQFSNYQFFSDSLAEIENPFQKGPTPW